MMKYLGITINPALSEIEICCSSTAEAQNLSNDLNIAIGLRNGQKTEVNTYKVVYRGDVKSLTNFLTEQNWKLTMDTMTRLIFDRSEQGRSDTANLAISK